MTFGEKTIVSVAFGPSIENVPDEKKNIIVLFSDNSVMTVKYSVLVQQLPALTNQLNQINTRLTDVTNLKSLCAETLGFTS